MRTEHERDIEKFFIREVKKRKGEVRKVKWIGRAHAPDRLALFRYKHFYAELKAPGEKVRLGQHREHERMRSAGMEVHVFGTKSAIVNFFYYFDKGFAR